ncbi:MAG: aminoacyl-histidine dipeptidase [Lachnospiraceae bacterium]|nr:aminoacyl-histidine dipeptidase [Lachnospiraceae bacterium]
MRVWENLEPKAVFHFFEDICGIPHGSGNTAQISAYLQQFASDRGIWYRTDALGNVVMRKPASKGYEDVPGLVLQGHMDMVAVKTADCGKDMEKEGLDPAIEGDYVYAVNTSLGGDDGIAVAYGLALLDDESILHPQLELIVTVDEETGMFGADALDMSDITGRRFLNLDSEEEGFFLTGCAGGRRLKAEVNRTLQTVHGRQITITVAGLKGGHSGAEIHKERGNAVLLLGRVLAAVLRETALSLVSISGGTAENVIPSQAQAVLVCPEPEKVQPAVDRVYADLRQEYEIRDPQVQIEVTIQSADGEYQADSPEDTAHFITLLKALPTGVQAMSQSIPGMVETSLNLGMISSDEEEITLQYSIRSSLESAKYALSERVEAIFTLAGARVEAGSDYPGWAYRVDSPLRDKMVRVYEQMYGEKPQITTIHAGLECGLFLGKCPDLDCVSIGPDMLDIHSTNEKLSISSTRRVWEYLLELLKDKA